MMKKTLSTISIALLVTCTVPALADIAVITNAASPAAVTKDDIANVYTGRNGSITPVNLTEANPIRSSFDEKGVGRTSSQLKAYWSKLVFTGKGTPPKELSSEAEVIQFVSSTPNSVGYVDAGSVNGNVKVAFTISK